MSKYGLALHTSSSELGLGLSNFAGNSRYRTWNLGRSLSTHLHQYLAEFMQPQTWTDLEFMVVAKGPGSFTGTRIGVVTARTIAQQLNIPLFSISTLAGVAWSQTRARVSPEAIAVQLPAQRGQLFGAIYKAHPSSGLIEVLPDSVMTSEAWQQSLDNWHPDQLIEASNDLGASVSSLLELAHLDWQQGKRPDWSEALPFYGQHPVDV